MLSTFLRTISTGKKEILDQNMLIVPIKPYKYLLKQNGSYTERGKGFCFFLLLFNYSHFIIFERSWVMKATIIFYFSREPGTIIRVDFVLCGTSICNLGHKADLSHPKWLTISEIRVNMAVFEMHSGFMLQMFVH